LKVYIIKIIQSEKFWPEQLRKKNFQSAKLPPPKSPHYRLSQSEGKNINNLIDDGQQYGNRSANMKSNPSHSLVCVCVCVGGVGVVGRV
jgi:hypothetical protein